MTPARAVRSIGGALFYMGAAALASIFLIVLVNRHWPLFLKPIQHLFAGLSDYIGGWAFIVEIWIFIGPGLALVKLADVMKEPKTR